MNIMSLNTIRILEFLKERERRNYISKIGENKLIEFLSLSR